MANEFFTLISTYGLKILYGLIILVIGYRVINIIDKKTHKRIQSSKIDPSLRSFTRSGIHIGLQVILLISVASIMGIETTSIVAILGAGSLAVGLALQGSLSNFAGGVLIIVLRPFKVDDFIEVSGQKGTVVDITIFSTQLKTPDNKCVIIPNALVSNGTLVNYSTFATRRVSFTFGVGYDSSIPKVKEILTKIVNAHELILDDPEPFIGLQAHNDSSLDFVVRVWVESPNYFKVYYDIMEQVKNAFDENNIEIPYPHCDVTLKNAE